MSKISCIKLDIENLESVRAQIRELFLQQDRKIAGIEDRVNVYLTKPRKTRRVFAVDSGSNSAYETSFSLLKAAVVNEEMEVYHHEDIYLFHVDNYQTDRLRRLLMQQSLYTALRQMVQGGTMDGSIVLVDGTITLTVFYPTPKDRSEYRRYFRDFYEKLYAPLMDKCLEKDIIILGFLKRTGSTYLVEHLDIRGSYDIYIMNSLLRENGQYLTPIPVVDVNAKRAQVYQEYVTFYLNLKNWNYRFELLKQQEDNYLACAENLLSLATEAHYGMNPIFSKADEYARVSKREANLKFDYVIHDLTGRERTQLRLSARKRTHFGYSTRRLPEQLSARARRG